MGGAVNNAGVQYPDWLNRSDTEKAARKEGDGDDGHVEVLYAARGREIARLEGELEAQREEAKLEVRQLRHQLAMGQAEKEQQGGSVDQLQQLLEDGRRQIKALSQEVMETKRMLDQLEGEKRKVEEELTELQNVSGHLQKQLTELRSSDTLLRARQQHDAIIRSLKERHEGEVEALKVELDQAGKGKGGMEREVVSLREQLRMVQERQDEERRDCREQVQEITDKLAAAQRRVGTLLEKDQQQEVARLKGELAAARREAEDERMAGGQMKEQIAGLKKDVAGYEAMSEADASDSMVALGLGGATGGADGTGQRIREELQRSLVGNRTKRDEIGRLEKIMEGREKELADLRRNERNLIEEKKLMELKVIQMSANVVNNEDRQKEVKEKGLLKERIQELEVVVQDLENKNREVKQYMGELVESNNTDKCEAIDSLREEYEQQIREAVEETKRLVIEEMEGECKRLKVEVDVYNKTLMEVRQQHRKVAEDRDKLEKEVGRVKEELLGVKQSKEKETVTVETPDELIRNDEIEAKIWDAERKVGVAKEREFELRIERIREEMRTLWEAEHKADVEEGVARARLDWLKRLPELQQRGGAARQSLGELEVVRSKLTEAVKDREKVVLKLAVEEAKRKGKEEELRRLAGEKSAGDGERERAVIEAGREGRREAEERLGKELKDALGRQQEQWERIVKTAREETEQQRRLIIEQYEQQIVEIVKCRAEEREEEKRRRDQMEEERKQSEKEVREEKSKSREMFQEKIKIENIIKKMEVEYNNNLQQWRRTIEEKNDQLENLQGLVGGETEGRRLREELERKTMEVERQRQETSGLVERWSREVAQIREEHSKEKVEFEEAGEKYRQLKQKVRRYQKHVESKEQYYKEEYSRLEADYRGTLEKLKGRMEEAYSVKERMVEKELGSMREHFSDELKKISSRKGKDGEGDRRSKTPIMLGQAPTVQGEVVEFMEELEKRTEQKIQAEIARQRVDLLSQLQPCRDGDLGGTANTDKTTSGIELANFFSKATKDIQELLHRPGHGVDLDEYKSLKT